MPPDQAPTSSDNLKSESSNSHLAEIAAIGAEIDRLEKLADSAPSAEQRTEARARLAELRKTSDSLKDNFDQTRYDALKIDVQTESDKISGWATRGPGGAPVASLAPAGEENDEAPLPQFATDREVLAAKIHALANPLHQNALAHPETLVADISSD